MDEEPQEYRGDDERQDRGETTADEVRDGWNEELTEKPAKTCGGKYETHLLWVQFQVVRQVVRHHCRQHEYAGHGAQERQHRQEHVSVLEHLAQRRALRALT